VKNYGGRQVIREIEEMRKNRATEHFLDSPFEFMDSLHNGERFRLKHLFSQFLVCGLPYFPKLVKQLKNIGSSVARYKKKIS
jgi:hypothetical protein